MASLAVNAITSAAAVTTDPYFPEVICQVQRLANIQAGKPAGTCPRTAKGLRGGVGLRYAAGPLRTIVAVRRRPIIAIGVAVSVVGLVFGAGYLVGKGGRS